MGSQAEAVVISTEITIAQQVAVNTDPPMSLNNKAASSQIGNRVLWALLE